MNNITFSPDGWADYLYWRTEDRKTLRKINQLLIDIQRNGLPEGTGKPEPLRHVKEWSRRIDKKQAGLYHGGRPVGNSFL